MQTFSRRWAGPLKLRSCQVFLAVALAMTLYTGYSGFRSGFDPAGVVLLSIALGVSSGAAAGAVWLFGRFAFNNLRVQFWPQIYFMAEGQLVHCLRAKGADRDAPPAAQFNRGADLIAFKWAASPWDEKAHLSKHPGLLGNKESLKKAANAHELMLARYRALAPVDPDLLVRYGGYVKRNMPLRQALGEGFRWATLGFFYEYSTLRHTSTTLPSKRKTGDKKLDPNKSGDLMTLIAEGEFAFPDDMSPATFFVRLENNVYGEALKAVRRQATNKLQTAKNLSYGVIGIMLLCIVLLFALNSGGEDERSDLTPIQATSTAVAQQQSAQGEGE